VSYAYGTKRLKIGINASHLNEEPTGIGVFTQEICQSVYDLHKNILVFSPVSVSGVSADSVLRVPQRTQGSKALSNNLFRTLYLNSMLPLRGRLKKIDIMYCPMLEFPFFPLAPLVVTVHDLHPLNFPSQFGLSSPYFNLSLHLLRRVAARVTVVSDYVKKELLAATNLPDDIVDVIPNGYDRRLFKPQDPTAKRDFLEKYSIRGNYILFVGNLFRYKNVKVLIDSFLSIRDRLDHCLVIVGKTEYSDESLPCDEKIRYMDYVPHEDLPKFYAYADLLVHPSLSEGFGFTPLEAMACGTPVLSSNRTSLPEVVGDAGILFDPANSETLSSLILEVLSNGTLLKKLTEKGFNQAEKFSWEKTAAGLLKSFEKAINERR
jgi:glycosyltransferase involved in cell wall biosynthesis